MATTKKPTTTKKPAAKKTAVVKAHRGMAHVPRGRRRPIGTPQLPRNPRRRRPITLAESDAMRRQREELRKARVKGRGTMIDFSKLPPAQQARIKKQQEANKKRMQQLTPAQRNRMRRQMEATARRQLPPQQRGPRLKALAEMTPAQQKAARDKFNKMQEAANKSMRANVFGRRRRPTQATQTPRRRPTGTPRPRGRRI